MKPKKNTGALLARGLRRHQAGQLAQAERAYRDVLARDPDNAGALHLLGMLAAQRGSPELAAALIAGAIRVGGPVARYCANLAGILRAQGKHREAATCYQQAAYHDPEDRTYPLELARTLLCDRRRGEAAEVLAKHLARCPDSAAGWHLLGIAFHQSGNDRDSAEALAHAVRLSPGVAEPWCDLGMVLAHLEAWDGAETAYRRAIAVRADFTEALNNLGNLLRRRGRAMEAVPLYRDALGKRADFVEAHYNLGLALQSLGNLDEAGACYAKALDLNPALAAAHNNLANTMQAMGHPETAIEHYERAIAIEQSNASYRVNLGMAQLLLGRFSEGWRNYAARATARPAEAALWDGSPLAGRRILLRAEQGFGDTIQFVRYGGLLQRRGGMVLMACPEPLMRLVATAGGIDRLLAEDEPAPAHDFWAPLLHLPAILDTRLESIPTGTPYLGVDPALAGAWREALAIPPAHLKVGIAWRGSAAHHNDRNRSIAPEELEALAGIPDISFVSLQAGEQAGCPESRLAFVPLGRELTDFADTAALMSVLDVVISVDTAAAHLAGALALPVWTLVPFAPDWRWLRERHDSPWYPSMRLFRQQRIGDWHGTLVHVREALAGRRNLDRR